MEQTRSSTTIFYVGPSLYGCRVERLRGEQWCGPARAGDIYSKARAAWSPKTIVLIDGIFYHDLAVWHKEIIYALLKGIVVIGAASMGALRAAELDRYGMIGVGEVYQRYRAGEEDDALVAMSFDPQTYKPLRDAPIGQEIKCADALAAIAFAREYTGGVKTSLSFSDFGEYLERTLERISYGG